eukprot:363998-Chlamydomonas_euryale.AAC.14
MYIWGVLRREKVSPGFNGLHCCSGGIYAGPYALLAPTGCLAAARAHLLPVPLRFEASAAAVAWITNRQCCSAGAAVSAQGASTATAVQLGVLLVHGVDQQAAEAAERLTCSA